MAARRVPGPRLDRRRAVRAAPATRAARALRMHCRGRAACRWSPPATCTCTCARAARCRTRSPRSALRTPVAECGYALHPNGERHLRSRARLAGIYPPALLAETLAIARALPFSLDELRYEYPRGNRAAGRDADVVSAQARRGRARRRYREAAIRRTTLLNGPSRISRAPVSVPRRGARADRARARADRRARLRALFPHRPRHRRVRALAQDILCQGRGSAANSAVCYALGITEVDPARGCDAVRALHQPRAQRAAGHRRRFRAPAARGGDAVRLRASTAATARRSPRR